jgi:hypothetical protein
MVQGSGIMGQLTNRRNMKVSIKPLDERPGMLTLTKNMLFTWQDIEEACIKLNCDNHKMWDELSGFPNKENKCVGVLETEGK